MKDQRGIGVVALFQKTLPKKVSAEIKSVRFDVILLAVSFQKLPSVQKSLLLCKRLRSCLKVHSCS